MSLVSEMRNLSLILFREAEHPSTNDPTQHYSALELDKDDNVIASKHYYK